MDVEAIMKTALEAHTGLRSESTHRLTGATLDGRYMVVELEPAGMNALWLVAKGLGLMGWCLDVDYWLHTAEGWVHVLDRDASESEMRAAIEAEQGVEVVQGALIQREGRFWNQHLEKTTGALSPCEQADSEWCEHLRGLLYPRMPSTARPTIAGFQLAGMGVKALGARFVHIEPGRDPGVRLT